MEFFRLIEKWGITWQSSSLNSDMSGFCNLKNVSQLFFIVKNLWLLLHSHSTTFIENGYLTILWSILIGRIDVFYKNGGVTMWQNAGSDFRDLIHRHSMFRLKEWVQPNRTASLFLFICCLVILYCSRNFLFICQF